MGADEISVKLQQPLPDFPYISTDNR